MSFYCEHTKSCHKTSQTLLQYQPVDALVLFMQFSVFRFQLHMKTGNIIAVTLTSSTTSCTTMQKFVNNMQVNEEQRQCYTVGQWLRQQTVTQQPGYDCNCGL